MEITWEEVRPAVDRMHQRKATESDYFLYLRWELEQAMSSLPPESKNKNGKPDDGDGFHAGCCALRAYSALFQLEDLIKRNRAK